MKSFIILILTSVVLSSCVVVRFPSEIKIHVDIPEQMTKEQIDQLVDQIPEAIKQDNVKARIEINSAIIDDN